MTKKEEVINAARDLFRIYGYKKVTMDEIAQKSVVTKKTIYTYFKDKDDLIKYFLYEEIEKMKVIVQDVGKKDLPFDLKIHQIIYKLIEHRKEEKLLDYFNDESKNLPLGIASEGSEILNQAILSEIKALLEKAIADGNIRKCNTELASFIIYKIYVALMFEWDKPLNQTELSDELIRFLKTGLLN
jgi:AcrR family transcriptional regulator